jgi:pimeloyl-ACP methyl ester carboxylesterase
MESDSRRLSDRGRYPDGVDGIEARFIPLRTGLRVRVVESGAPDAFPIVLVPGWGCGAWIFHETMLPLAACGFRAIAVELKGHGFSDKPLSADEYTLDSMRDHLIDILDALAIESAGIIGHSMGAAIAVQVAAKSPERVKALTVAAPVGFAGVRGLTLFRLITPAAAIPVLSHLVTRTLIRVMLSLVYGSLRRASAEDIEEFYAPVKTPGGTMSLRHLLHELDWNREYPDMRIPVMTVLGSEDVLSPASDAARYKPAETNIIEGAGHVLFDEAPDLVGSALCKFFAAHRSPYISSYDDQDERHS